MAAPTSFTITATASLGTAPWTGQQVWTVTAPWGTIVRPTFMEAIEQVVWKAGAQYGGRMQAYFASGTTNATEVGQP